MTKIKTSDENNETTSVRQEKSFYVKMNAKENAYAKQMAFFHKHKPGGLKEASTDKILIDDSVMIQLQKHNLVLIRLS